MPLEYQQVNEVPVDVYIDVLRRSTLAERRPVDDRERMARMLANSNLLVVAKDGETGRVVGLARSITDFAYCCYLSDLAVDQAWQGRGIGTTLLAKTREIAGPECMCLLVSAPGAAAFYHRVGMPRQDRAFAYPRER